MAPWISTPWSSHFCLIPDLSFVSYCFFSVEYHLLWISLPEVGYSSLSTVYLCGSLNIRTSCKLLVLCLTSRVSQHSLISACCIFCDSICPGMKCTNDKINALIIDFLAWLVCIGPRELRYGASSAQQWLADLSSSRSCPIYHCGHSWQAETKKNNLKNPMMTWVSVFFIKPLWNMFS